MIWYFISFAYRFPDGRSGHAAGEFATAKPIRRGEDLGPVVEQLKRQVGYESVVILYWRRFER